MSLGLAACGDGRTAGSASGNLAVPSGGMTYRTNPTTGDKVSLLGCGQCSPHCPQRIDIPAELHRIDAYVERLRQNTL